MNEDLKKEIIAICKAEGMDVAEEAAVMAVNTAFSILQIVVPKVSVGAGAIVVPMIEVVKPKVMELLDKIDGEDDPGR